MGGAISQDYARTVHRADNNDSKVGRAAPMYDELRQFMAAECPQTKVTIHDVVNDIVRDFEQTTADEHMQRVKTATKDMYAEMQRNYCCGIPVASIVLVVYSTSRAPSWDQKRLRRLVYDRAMTHMVSLGFITSKEQDDGFHMSEWKTADDNVTIALTWSVHV
jgi:phage major head subunit gpT-like protein